MDDFFISGINRKIDFSHAAKAYSGFLLNEFLVPHLEQSTHFSSFLNGSNSFMVERSRSLIIFLLKYRIMDNGSAEVDLKVCSVCPSTPVLQLTMAWGSGWLAASETGELWGGQRPRAAPF